MTESFIESIENVEPESKFNYLLNFWYTAKLNKELNYVKRNGIHPTLKFINLGSSNTFEVEGGADVSTLFYTVFRIYIENAFTGFKFKKERNAETWTATFEANQDYPLDNPVYTRMSYANENRFRTTNQIISFSRQSGANFQVRIHNQNSLYVKSVINELAEINDYCARDIDARLPAATGLLFNKLGRYLDLPVDHVEVATKKTTKKAPSRRTSAEIMDMPSPTRPVPNVQVNTLEFDNLLELYQTMSRSMPSSFNERTKFSFLVTFANSSGLPTVVDSEENFRRFETLRSQPRRAA